MRKDFLYETLLSNHLITKIFIPVSLNVRDNNSFDELVLIYDDSLLHCLTLPMNNERNIIYLKRNGLYIHHHYDAIIPFSDKKVWLIPVDDIYDFSTILLNEKKDCYIIGDKLEKNKIKKGLEKDAN